MMKKLFALSVILIAFTAGAFAQTNQATATATATIVTPITLSREGNLSFGNIVPPISGTGYVTVQPSGPPIYTDVSGSPSPTATADVTPAIFTVSGTPGAAYNILLPASAITLSAPNGATMTVDDFVSSPDETAGGTLDDQDGEDELRVGATLEIGANQAAGTYTGSFSVTVNYD